MISPDILKAIEICLELNIPFAAYSLPQSKKVVFFANPDSSCENKAYLDGRHEFVVNYFNNAYPYIIGVQDRVSEFDIISNAETYIPLPAPEVNPWRIDTNYILYREQVASVVERLSVEPGKTVLSRVVTGELSPNWIDELNTLFNNTGLFRSIFFTQETGCWIGATPELLLDCSHQSGQLTTMSLAGTRVISTTNADWDEKNIEEHNYVTEYIVATLQNFNLCVSVSDSMSVKYGSIEHLCHKITSNIGDADLIEIIHALSPTPAVAGFPKKVALEEIASKEAHPRYCYAGYIGVSDFTGLHLYVNLRCAHIGGERICIYGGGGITAKSDAKEEWLETEMKMRNMSRFLR